MPSTVVQTRLSGDIQNALRAACGDDASFTRVLDVVEQILNDAESKSISLQRSHATLQALVENFPGGIVSVFDPQMRHLFVGGETVTRLGFDTSEMIGKTPSEYKAGPGADMLESTLQRTYQGEAVRNLEEDGNMLTLVISTPIYDSGGTLVGAVVVGQDVTDLVTLQDEIMAEERVRAGLQREVATTRARAAIIEQILHEVRNPLASLSSSAEMLERYEDRMNDEKRAEHLRRIYAECRALAAVLSQLAQIND